MAKIHRLSSDVVVSGWSCRLPGADSVADFWSMLTDARCAVTEIPPDRWSLERFGHPRRQLRGRSYTWAAGVLDRVWDFDPSLFGISPREAEQMDPQQRILLELAWEALEDAGIPPSTIAGTNVGVYIGGSSTDFANFRTADASGGDSHFATGNALSVLANRISYAFDLHGPSLTIDTACSSSLVALHHAIDALRSNRIETAIVGGINVLASPFSFISFSQASMLSPTGRCRAFSADADGYVRAEGGVALVLRRLPAGSRAAAGSHGLIVATDVNSDGRTSGIALPSPDAQHDLLKRIYTSAGVDLNRLAFVEAHGTGTPAGDPIEAGAIGRALGQQRRQPLPIGSVKTNIGHLEPASGLAGLLKAMLALKHAVLPGSLHCSAPNPAIPFADLNLQLATALQPLSGDRNNWLAGVNSFGFGGTNAHVIIAPAPGAAARVAGTTPKRPAPLILSADSAPALSALARRYAGAFATATTLEADRIVRAAAHRRNRLAHRLVLAHPSPDNAAAALEAFAADGVHPLAVSAIAPSQDLQIAFVYSGNGSQFVGMGRHAYRANADFRSSFDQVDATFTQIAGWSLAACLHADDLDARLPRTSIAQPLIFAIEVATTTALARRAIRPSVVLGHSVGEVAAAWASGALDLETAVRVIHFRSLHQELTASTGDMAALLTSPDVAAEIAHGIDRLEIAAINGPRAVTMAGTVAALHQMTARANALGHTVIPLNLGYPFHTSFMAPIEKPLTDDLAGIEPRTETIRFISTVTGCSLAGPNLDANYWWRNVREPVRFSSAIEAAAEHGAGLFLEIGPRGTLQRHVRDCLEPLNGDGRSLAAFDVRPDTEPPPDPIEAIVGQLLANGAALDSDAVYGPNPIGRVDLPTYPWQHRAFRFEPTCEGLGYQVGPWHPLSGDRYIAGGLEWHAMLDTMIMPELADHAVGGQVILPGSGFLEIALSVARQWLETADVGIGEFEIMKPMNLSDADQREILTRIAPGANTVEILSRPRLSGATWLLHARGKLFTGVSPAAVPADVAAHAASAGPRANANTIDGIEPIVTMSGSQLYALARRCGLNYGPAFALVRKVERRGTRHIRVDLHERQSQREFLLDPMLVDACFHGLFTLFPALGSEARGVAYIPVRIDQATIHPGSGTPASAEIDIRRAGPRSILADFRILNAGGEIVAALTGTRFLAVSTRRRPALEQLAVVERMRLMPAAGPARMAPPLAPPPPSRSRDLVELVRREADALLADQSSDGSLMLEGWATAAAYEITSGLADDGILDVESLVSAGRLSVELKPWLLALISGLRTAGLIENSVNGFSIVDDPLLPSSADVLAEIAASHPSRAAELLLAGEISVLAAEIANNRKIAGSAATLVSSSARDFYELSGQDCGRAIELVMRATAEADLVAPGERALRILLVGASHLAGAMQTLPGRGDTLLSVLEPDPQRWERKRPPAAEGHVEHLTDTASLPSSCFDLVLSTGDLGRFDQGELTAIARAMAPGAVALALEPPPSMFRNIVFGLPAAGASSPAPASPRSTSRSAAQWQRALHSAGFQSPETIALTTDRFGWVALAAGAPGASRDDEQAATTADLETTAPTRPAASPASSAKAAAILPRPIVVLSETDRQQKLAGLIAEQLAVAVGTLHQHSAPANDAPHDLVLVLSATDPHQPPHAVLASRCLALQQLASNLGPARATVWIVHQAAPAGDREQEPLTAGTWAFCRTLANEYPQSTMHRIEIAPRVPLSDAAARLAELIASGTAETELRIEPAGFRAMRVETLRQAASPLTPKAAAARLQRSTVPGQRTCWQAIDRPTPGSGEMEIEVAATGLNFRDLMWSMDLLPDDMLEDGFTGPTLGLECAGRVTRVGPGITSAGVGDRVVALAPSAFSTHVVVGEHMVAKVPGAMLLEAAATLPVAFITAYYSLVTQARLERGEWVLIHGAAGAVGLAAIQIAEQRGARIIATAGSSAKRDLLRTLGVEHVLDSRSTAFVESVGSITGQGVDVVLNSLAGEAMERSMQCLRPFGRFVELGKRDYVSNTHIGLRPFRRNLSYFGVDVDQLIEGRREVGQTVFTDVITLIRDGVLTPLPYSVFEAGRTADAFQLMQQSGHIGKIVVRPPDPATIAAPLRPFAVDPGRTHLITGGLGGFGLATAQWLVERGARHLALIGRRGASDEAARSAIAAFQSQGVKVVAARCDVTDAPALEAELKALKTTMPPLAGVIHAAMVLEDGLIANLDAGQLQRVLAPKVQGAANLDRLTRGQALDYFVLYSSITTLIGNPGQASYVAANGYLEGLARARRQQGLPGLAIGWGPILDVGVVASNDKLQKALIDRRGMTGMTAADALDLMAEALAEAGHDATLAAITIAGRDWTQLAGRLAVLASPSFSGIVGPAKTSSEQHADNLDLRTLVAAEDATAVKHKVVAMISTRLAAVLHTRAEDLNKAKPLSDLGLDSLMSLELASSLEAAFQMPLAVSGAVGTLSISALADQLIAQASRGQSSETELKASALADKHFQTVAPEQVEALTALATNDEHRYKRLHN